MYTFESRVRYSESDESGRLSLEGALNYFQDCSTFQSEDLGMGFSSLREKRRAWWLSSWQVVFHRRPSFFTICSYLRVIAFLRRILSISETQRNIRLHKQQKNRK